MAKRKATRRWPLVALAVVLGLIGAAALFPEQLLCVRHSPRRSDAIVVLGGEPGVRAERAAMLATNGFARLILVSGSGDCEDQRRVLEARGVARQRIEMECESTSTQENARFSVERLRKRECKRVIIVTSWCHSRRALSSFRHYAPEITFISCPAQRKHSLRVERGYIASEYFKTLGYVVRWGIWPTW